MARIKTVLSERVKTHDKACGLVSALSKGEILQEGDLLVEMQKQDKLKQVQRKRKFRQRINYRTRRPSLFV